MLGSYFAYAGQQNMLARNYKQASRLFDRAMQVDSKNQAYYYGLRALSEAQRRPFKLEISGGPILIGPVFVLSQNNVRYSYDVNYQWSSGNGFSRIQDVSVIEHRTTGWPFGGGVGGGQLSYGILPKHRAGVPVAVPGLTFLMGGEFLFRSNRIVGGVGSSTEGETYGFGDEISPGLFVVGGPYREQFYPYKYFYKHVSIHGGIKLKGAVSATLQWNNASIGTGDWAGGWRADTLLLVDHYKRRFVTIGFGLHAGGYGRKAQGDLTMHFTPSSLSPYVYTPNYLGNPNSIGIDASLTQYLDRSRSKVFFRYSIKYSSLMDRDFALRANGSPNQYVLGGVSTLFFLMRFGFII